MNFSGVIIGAATFVMIAAFHPIVIKAEYYFGKRFWLVFLLVGLAAIAGSLFLGPLILSAVLGIFGFSSLWAIGEIIEQEERVESGRFPYHPTRQHHAHIREKMEGKKVGR